MLDQTRRNRTGPLEVPSGLGAVVPVLPVVGVVQTVAGAPGTVQVRLSEGPHVPPVVAEPGPAPLCEVTMGLPARPRNVVVVQLHSRDTGDMGPSLHDRTVDLR